MKASRLLDELGNMGIHTITGVPDSTLKQFCDGIENYKGELSHYVAANEGAAVGLAIGSFLATGKPACVYMQNSGIGNAVNPLASLANGDVNGVPMLGSRESRTNPSMSFRERSPAAFWIPCRYPMP